MDGAVMKTFNSSNRATGFTLVEMIVVMAIMSVIMMAVMTLYIPVQRSALIQTDLGDVQGNLRLALDRMTQDFRTAGFLTAGDALSGYTLSTGDPTVSDPTDTLVINTRTISGRYGRIETPPADTGAFQFILHDALQVDKFRIDDFVAIVQPVEGDVVNSKVYMVGSTDRANRTVTLLNTDGSAIPGAPHVDNERGNLSDTITGNVLLVASDAVPANLNRTITYGHLDTDGDGTKDTLTRTIGGSQQFLARKVSFVQFIVTEDADGDPHKVTIVIEGQTINAGNDAVSSQKTKRMRTVVSLRNV
jgi:prepilin-type N-terminal cleavage/methylation domain-containing protein